MRLTDHRSCGRFTKNQQKKLLVGAWNVRTLLDRDNTARPERRIALIAKELARYRIDIAALSETRLADEGILKEDGSGYTFFWRGKPEAEDRLHGARFAIRTSLMKSIPSLPVGINEWLMKLRLPQTKSRHLTIISAYAPTLTNSDETKEKFYEDLDQLIRSTSPIDKLLIMGDFNARVRKDQASWKTILGSQGVGKMNSNGLLLLSKCAEHELCITNTVFRQADKFKTTWMHPRSKQWHSIDYIIVRQRELQDVCICYAWCRMLDSPLTDQGSAETLHRTCSTKVPKDSQDRIRHCKTKERCSLQKFQDTLDANIQNATLTEDCTENGTSSRTLSMKQPSPS